MSNATNIAPSTHSYQELQKAIIDGDTQILQRLTSKDINSLLPIIFVPKSAKYPYESYVDLNRGTVPMFAVLCERPEFLGVIIDTKDPDFTKTTYEGYNILHLSAMTKDSSCLELLLHCESIQKHINDGVKEGGLRKNPTTNALHIAVAKQNHKAACLLLKKLPRTQNQRIGADFSKSGISPNILSNHGTLPLNTAIYNADLEMTYILLHAGADPTSEDSHGQNANLIFKKYIDERRNPLVTEFRSLLEAPVQIVDADKEMDYILQRLNRNKPFMNNMMARPCSAYEHDDSDSQTDDDETDTPSISAKESQHFDDRLNQLIHQVSTLTDRVTQLESQVTRLEFAPPLPPEGHEISCTKCEICSSLNITICPICGKPLCPVCIESSHHLDCCRS